MCVLPKSLRRASRSCPVRKTDAGETVSLPAGSGQQPVDASGGKAVTKVYFIIFFFFFNGFTISHEQTRCSDSGTSEPDLKKNCDDFFFLGGGGSRDI